MYVVVTHAVWREMETEREGRGCDVAQMIFEDSTKGVFFLQASCFSGSSD